MHLEYLLLKSCHRICHNKNSHPYLYQEKQAEIEIAIEQNEQAAIDWLESASEG